MGLPDPRHTSTGQMDPRLTNLVRAWANADPPPNRVKPLSIDLLHHAQSLAEATPHELIRATIDMGWLAFFFLLRPGEYCKPTDNSSPLLFRHLGLTIGQQPLAILTCPLADIMAATHASLTFDTQKNRARGEQLSHGRSGHTIACPVRTMIRRVLHLRLNNATANTPLCAAFHHTRWVPVTSALLTARLRVSAAALPHLGLAPAKISARSARAGGAMALLCGRVDHNVIKLVGRWRSDAIFRYLHAQALPLVNPLAGIMLRHGSYALVPGVGLPQPAIDLFNQVPAPPAVPVI